MDNVSEIGERLKEFAKSNFASVAALERKLNLAPNSLSQYTNGRSKPGAKLLDKLKEVGCDIGWLLYGSESGKMVGVVREHGSHYSINFVVPESVDGMKAKIGQLEATIKFMEVKEKEYIDEIKRLNKKLSQSIDQSNK